MNVQSDDDGNNIIGIKRNEIVSDDDSREEDDGRHERMVKLNIRLLRLREPFDGKNKWVQLFAYHSILCKF